MSGHGQFWKHEITWMIDLEARKVLVIRHIGEIEPALVQVDPGKVGYGRDHRHIDKRKQVPHPLQNKIPVERLYRIWK